MVSNEEIKRMLDQKRRGIKPEKRPKKGQYRSVEDKTPCPSCGTDNPSTAKFCVGCGAELSKQEKIGSVCPSCGFENPEQAKFCVKCGENLEKTHTPEPPSAMETEVATVEVPSQEVETSKDYKICPSCQNKNPVNAKFCVVCGHTFKDQEQPEKVEIPENDTSVASKEVDTSPESQKLDTIESPESDTSIEVDTSFESKDVQKEETEMERASEDAELDPVERIKKAKELLDMGAITQEDFDKIKKKYLDEI